MRDTHPIGLTVCQKCAKKHVCCWNFYLEYTINDMVITMFDYQYAKWRYDAGWDIPDFPVKTKI